MFEELIWSGVKKFYSSGEAKRHEQGQTRTQTETHTETQTETQTETHTLIMSRRTPGFLRRFSICNWKER